MTKKKNSKAVKSSVKVEDLTPSSNPRGGVTIEENPAVRGTSMSKAVLWVDKPKP